MAHKLVRETAQELAGAFFDNEDVFNDGRVYRTERFRDQCRDQQAFIHQYWRDFVPLARKLLAHMLTEPGRPDQERDEIYDALLKDRGFKTDADKVAPSIIQLN